MSRKFTKKEMLDMIASKGYTEAEAVKIWEMVSDVMFEVLAQGGTVPIVGVGKLIGDVLPAGEIELFGSSKKAAERLQIKFSKSRTADNKFKSHYSSEAIKRKKLKAMAQQLSKK